MPSTLEVLCNAVRARMEDLQGENSWAVGEKHLHANANPPRIVWVPIGGRIESPDLRSDVLYTLDGVQYKARHIHDDHLTVQAHIWAADYEKWERLRGRLHSAVRQCFGTASTPGQYGITTEAQRSGYTVLGTAGIQQFTWKLKVCEFTGRERREAGTLVPFKALVTVLNQTHDCQINTSL
jgi:hypothetical protein